MSLGVDRVWRVTEITRHIKHLLESSAWLRDTWVRGELSNFKRHTSGHLYFSLKDDTASLACVMFRYRATTLVFPPRNGMRVLCRGSIGVYERDGTYQLYVEQMQPDGTGSLWQALEELKRKLAHEGLFAPERKRPLPRVPRRIAVVTSPTGAAIRDIVSVSNRRFPGMGLLLVPVLVQGEEAPGQVARALCLINSYRLADVIIVGRGGGTMEELWAFNDEEVARAIASSAIPVVSAVGHESDVTIADLVADVRAATPSHAAEIVVPFRAQEVAGLAALQARLATALGRRIQGALQRLQELRDRPCLRRPETLVWERRQQLDSWMRRLGLAASGHSSRSRLRLQALAGRLEALNPAAILGRGYAICLHLPNRTLVRTIDGVVSGDGVAVRLADGELECQVRERRSAG